MKTQKGRSRADIARALERLAREQTQPVAELRSLLAAPMLSVIRWIIHGYRGIFLDGVLDPKRGWLTSRDAIDRFLRARGKVVEMEGYESHDSPDGG